MSVDDSGGSRRWSVSPAVRWRGRRWPRSSSDERQGAPLRSRSSCRLGACPLTRPELASTRLAQLRIADLQLDGVALERLRVDEDDAVLRFRSEHRHPAASLVDLDALDVLRLEGPQNGPGRLSVHALAVEDEDGRGDAGVGGARGYQAINSSMAVVIPGGCGRIASSSCGA